MNVPIGSDAKQAVRERVWDSLQRDSASRDPHGRIPDFVGAAATAQQLSALPAWQRADVLKANPDQVQLPVRVQALREGKLIYMAVPKLADPLPFFGLIRSSLTTSLRRWRPTAWQPRWHPRWLLATCSRSI